MDIFTKGALWDYKKIRGYEIEVSDDESSDLKGYWSDKEETAKNFKNMIKYSFNDEEEYVAVKEDEYNDLKITSEEACRAYQEIFRMMDEGWMDLVKEISMKLVECIFSGILLIMEYMVKDSKKRVFWRLNEDILKITILKNNTPEDQYAVLEIWNEYNILEDIKRGPYSKKSPIRRIQSLDTPYQTDFQTL
ncbi:hypothetical protein Tco_0073763 [Tanacetum coccineum]